MNKQLNKSFIRNKDFLSASSTEEEKQSSVFVFLFQIMSADSNGGAESSPLNLDKDIQRAVVLLERLRTNSEIPEGKLLELQRILQSDFFHAVREVYEKIYDTVQITGSPEVRANATAKATVRSVPYESERHAHRSI